MPSDAYNVFRYREVRSHKQVPDGQTCSTQRRDQGDGSYSTERVCYTNYRSEPVYDYRCHYTVLRVRNIWFTYSIVIMERLKKHPVGTLNLSGVHLR